MTQRQVTKQTNKWVGVTHLWFACATDPHAVAQTDKVSPQVPAIMFSWNCLESDYLWAQTPLLFVHLDPVGRHSQIWHFGIVSSPAICSQWYSPWCILVLIQMSTVDCYWAPLTRILSFSLVSHFIHSLWIYFVTSCILGKSRVIAFGLIATRQLRKTALFVTANAWRVNTNINWLELLQVLCTVCTWSSQATNCATACRTPSRVNSAGPFIGLNAPSSFPCCATFGFFFAS